MFTKRHVGLLAAALASLSLCGVASAAGTANSTLTVSATLTTACDVSPTASISFGSFAALASSNDRTADSASTFQVACSSSATPTIYATGERKMLNGANGLPFKLSLTEGADADDLPSDSGSASTFTLTQDGSLHDVVLYAKTLAADFKGLPSGAYTTNVTVSVAY